MGPVMCELSSAGIEWIDREGIIEEAKAVARRIASEHPEVQRTILFGSLARGRGGPRSDLDIVLIVTQTSIPPRDRTSAFMPVSKRPIDLFVYTDEETTREPTAPVLREALQNGMDLL
jgi:predicted nucleotidyltransferase